MTTVFESLRSVMYSVRGILSELGLRPYTVSVIKEIRTNKFSGASPTITSTTHLLEGNSGNPKVSILSTKDYLRGAPPDAFLSVELTPEFVDGYGGTSFETLEATEENETLYYEVSGPGLDDAQFVKESIDCSNPITYILYLRRKSQ